jgi:hypothetical protein
MGRQTGYGPDDLGDDEQEAEVSEYDLYTEDPPDGGILIAEDDDDDAEAAEDWAAAHPDRVTEEAGADAELDANMEREGVAGGDDESAENAAMHEIPGT